MRIPLVRALVAWIVLAHPVIIASGLSIDSVRGHDSYLGHEQSRDIALPVEVPRRFTAEVTAYSSSPDETWGDPFITASGRRVHDGVVACPRRFAFGAQFRIDSRIYTCWDRLHPRFDHRFDIWKPSKQEALKFGRRVLVIEAL
jgi:hypothetical protein